MRSEGTATGRGDRCLFTPEEAAWLEEAASKASAIDRGSIERLKACRDIAELDRLAEQFRDVGDWFYETPAPSPRLDELRRLQLRAARETTRVALARRSRPWDFANAVDDAAAAHRAVARRMRRVVFFPEPGDRWGDPEFDT